MRRNVPEDVDDDSRRHLRVRVLQLVGKRDGHFSGLRNDSGNNPLAEAADSATDDVGIEHPLSDRTCVDVHPCLRIPWLIE